MALIPKTQVMVLGAYHMANPKLDLVKTELDDHLSPKRQKEIEDVLGRLAKFQPTKILVEARPSGQTNAQYHDYLQGKYTLTANEVDQIGMRLAQRLHHADIYPVDWRNDMDFEAVFAFAKDHDPDFTTYVNSAMADAGKMMEGLAKHTVRENLLLLNSRETLRLAHEPYIKMLRLQNGTNYPGAELVAGWYSRNLHIYANLQKLAQPNDRILMIFGSGHAPILRQLVKEDGTMDLIEPSKYLK